MTIAALALSACGAGDPDTDDTAPSPSSSLTPTPSATPSESVTESPDPEPPEEPPAKNNPVSRRAFARFVVDTWGYALTTNKAEALTGLSPGKQPCRGCRDFEKELSTRERQGWYVDFPGARVKDVELSPGSGPDEVVAAVKIDIPESASYFEDGSFRNDNQARKNATFEVLMRFDEGAKQRKASYSLLAFTVR